MKAEVFGSNKVKQASLARDFPEHVIETHEEGAGPGACRISPP